MKLKVFSSRNWPGKPISYIWLEYCRVINGIMPDVHIIINYFVWLFRWKDVYITVFSNHRTLNKLVFLFNIEQTLRRQKRRFGGAVYYHIVTTTITVYFITPLTNILPFHWFSASHDMSLVLLDGGRVIVHRLPFTDNPTTITNPIRLCICVFETRVRTLRVRRW